MQVTCFDYSTPISSKSDLNKFAKSNLKDDEMGRDQVCKKAKFMRSSIFQDQKELKEILGVFKVYGNVDSMSWFSKVKQFCMENYLDPNEIINYFHILLDESFHKWLFNLAADKKSDLQSFEKEFHDEVFRLESEYESLMMSGQADFMDKFKKIFDNNENLDDEFRKHPLSSFIKLKIMVIKKLYPRIVKEDAVRMTIYSIDDKETKKRFILFIKSELSDILNYAKSLDLYGKK